MLAPRLRPLLRLGRFTRNVSKWHTQLFVLAILTGGTVEAFALPLPASTTTNLSATSGGNAVTSVSAGSVVTLTASVAAGSVSVAPGKINFCDVSAPSCTDIHLIGTAQLTSNGTASIKFIPGAGNHSYKAVFAGTNTNASSSSSSVLVTVTNGNSLSSTTTSLGSTGSPGNYALSATVTTPGASFASGTLSFLDTSNANASIGSATLSAGTFTVTFTNPSSPSVGQAPVTIAKGDFNNDGIPDLVIGNAINNTPAPITELLGTGAGAFTTGSITTAGTGAFCDFAVGDFNNDGKQDLAAMSCDYSGVIRVMLGNGDGTFASPISTSVSSGYDPTSLVAEDFNGDGQLDLALVNQIGPDRLVVLLGDGTGAFSASTPQPTLPYLPADIVAGDINQDGRIDLVVSSASGGAVMVCLGNGDGTFTQGTSPATASSPLSVALSDFNQDGKLDIAVTTGGVFANNNVTVLLGNGDGTFLAAPSSAAIDPAAEDIRIGDFNGDGKADVAVTNNSTNKLTVLFGNGDGTLSVSATPATGATPIGLVATDLDGDGTTDLASVNNGIKTATILLAQSLRASTASLSGVSLLGTGTHQVTANYGGDNSNGSSISNAVSLTAQKVTPNVTLTLSSSTVTTVQSMTVTVIVSQTGAPTSTGTVTLTSGSYTSTATALTSGGATITIPAGSLALGTATLTASYSGDGNYNAASGTAAVTVTSPSFAISGTSVAILVGTSTGNTSTVTIAPSGGFTGNVALTAVIGQSPVGAQYAPTLSFGSTSPVNITGTTPGTATLIVTTTAASQALMSEPGKPFPASYLGGGVTLACLFFLGGLGRKRRWTKAAGVLSILLALSSGIQGCSGGGGKTSTPGTSTGTYTVTITGTSGSLTATNTVTITVQ